MLRRKVVVAGFALLTCRFPFSLSQIFCPMATVPQQSIQADPVSGNYLTVET